MCLLLNFQKIEKHIKELWKNVIVRYVDYCNDGQILNKLSSQYDYYKFHSYMLKYNRMYRHVLDRIKELEN